MVSAGGDDLVAIPSGAVLFLSELGLQIHLFTRSMEALRSAAKHWVDLDRGIDNGQKYPPLEIVANCVVCLSAMAAVRRVLYPTAGSSVAVQRRARALLAVLGDPPLTAVMDVAVRNSWEHLDERLDKYLVSHPSGARAVSGVHVSASVPAAGTVALRRFEPVGLAVHFADQRIALQPCADEMNDLSVRIDQAYVRLRTEQVDV
jgi:hypothetical protein